MASRMLIRPLDFDVLKGAEWDFEKAWRLGNNIPGYRVSSTFLSTLRTNIHLSTTGSVPSSPTVPPTIRSRLLNTKPSLLSITADYQMSTPAISTPTDADSLPTLKTHAASTNAEKTAALKLIADSVAQQRQVAAKSILFHQYALATLMLILGLQAYWLSPIALLTTAAGTIMIELVAVRYVTRGYIFAAEEINWNWLLENPPSAGHSRSNSSSSNNSHKRGRSNTTEGPLIVVTKWGEEIIGALVIRVSKRERKAFVRAWTVLRRYRGKGVGRGLLEEGVARAMGKAGVKGLEFEDDHANSIRILPPFLNATFDAQEDRARDILNEVVSAQKRNRRNS